MTFPWTKTALIAALLGGGFVLVGGLAPSAIAGAADSDQKIYLDPDTGEVAAPPVGHEAQDHDTPAAAARRRSDSADPRAWTNAQGVEMLTPRMQDAPRLEAVQCPDGSLRMGHARHDDTSDHAGLCAESQR